jgi:hypothetical protein
MLALAPVAISRATWTGTILIVAGGILLTKRAVASDVTLGWAEFARLRGLPHAAVDTAERATRFAVAALSGLVTGAAAVGAGRTVIDSPALRALVFASAFAACLMAYTSASLRASILRRSASKKDNNAKPDRSGRVRDVFRLVTQRPASTSQSSPIAALVRWRAGQIARTPSTWWLLGAWMVAMSGVFAACLSRVPTAFVALFACLSGWLAAQPLALHAANEANELRFEEACGITRVQIAAAYRYLGAVIAITSGLAAAALSAILINGSAATCFAAGAVAPSLMPVLIWQIDARRPLVQALTSLILGLFLATAIVASKAAFLLWPVVLVLLAHQQLKRLAHDQSV